MSFIIFASFITFCIWLKFYIKKNHKLGEKAEREFWEKEYRANSVRKKSLDGLNYIKFPFDKLPSAESFGENNVPESLVVLRSLEGRKMVNLNGISNTDLKLEYGTANITTLSEFDNNYTLFAKYVYELALCLYDLNRKEEALFLLEETIPTGTDSLSHYRLLADIYREMGQTNKLNRLKEAAEALPSHSLTKRAILRELEK